MNALNDSINDVVSSEKEIVINLSNEQYKEFYEICGLLGVTPEECLQMCIAKTRIEQRLPFLVSYIPDPFNEDVNLKKLIDEFKEY